MLRWSRHRRRARRQPGERSGCAPQAQPPSGGGADLRLARARRMRARSGVGARVDVPVSFASEEAAMLRYRRRALIALSILVLGAAVTGGVVAATQSSDEQALQPSQTAGPPVDARVNRLLAQMTLEEKLSRSSYCPTSWSPTTRYASGLGSVLSVTDPARISELQRIAVEESRLKIPLLFAFDTIHGFRTIFPIPLGAARELRPGGGLGRRHVSARASRPPSASSRPTPRWSTSRTSRAGAGSPRAPARTRT